ncbi:hypothetical protein [Sphingomonas parapaucimobilis]|uniref:Lipoprotein n=1 Tax=Sphingomonas parapaucimobilis NBRC 15100 TaxID=1219049 RepID=A0A0A1W6K1_9SPHN|nr:hypothetical protein [Sphingomonas parapaucimobilis]GAM00539.1 hypothetical protein SP5_034_01130 [Sphingomonas parapaucimobilis NBRC 15100]
MRQAILTLGVLLLCGCASKVEQAKENVKFQEEHGTVGGLCDAQRALAKAYEDAKDGDNYRIEVLIAETTCDRAAQVGGIMPANEQDPAYSIEPDNMDALPDTTSTPSK